MDGFILGVIIGALGVFLFGTKSGKNLVKIISEQGLEGLSNLMEEYDLTNLGKEFENDPEVKKQTVSQSKVHNEIHEVRKDSAEPEVEAAPKKRFFKRLRN